MRRAWIAAAALVLAARAWCFDVRLGGGCAVHLVPHPAYDEPLDDAPVAFATAGLEVMAGESGLALDVAAGRGGGATDGQATFSFRHTLHVDWGVFAPFLQVGIGWAGRFSGTGLTQSSLFPEAGAGIEAAMAAFTGQLVATFRPAPLPVLEADEYPLRRVAFAARVRWTVPQRGRSGRRGLM